MYTVDSTRKEPRPPLWPRLLIVSVTAVAVVAVVFLGRHTQHETRQTAIRQFNEQQLVLARSLAAGIEAYHRELSQALASLAKVPAVQQMTPDCLPCIQHTYWGFPSRTSIRLLDETGVLRSIYPFDDWRSELIGKDYGHEPFFQKARTTGRLCTSRLLTNEQGEPRIRITVPIHRTHDMKTVRTGRQTGILIVPMEPEAPDYERFQGVLLGSIDPHALAGDFILPVTSGRTGYAWLLNEAGRFIAHPEPGFTDRNAFEVRRERNPDVSYEAVERLQRRMMAGEEGTGTYVSGCHRGRREETANLVAYVPVHVNGNTWSVAVCAPVAEVEDIIRTSMQSGQVTLGLVVLLLLTGGFLLLWLSHRWASQLERAVFHRSKALREARDYLDRLIRHANAPIIVLNSAGRVTMFNKAFEEITGQTEAEMRYLPLEVLFPEDSRADSVRKVHEALTGRRWKGEEIPILGRDGTTRMGLWNSASIYADDGTSIVGTVAQGQDITERILAVRALRDSEERLQALLETAKDAVFLADETGRFVDVNPAACKSLGYTREELLDLYITDIAATPEGREAFRKVQDVPASRLSFEVGQRRKNGTLLPTEIAASSFEAAGKRIFLAVARDLTERRRAEEAIRRSEVERRQAQKMETIGTLAGGVAHDFNNILTTISGNTELALRRIAEDTQSHRHLLEVRTATERAAGLTRQLLLFARKEPIRVVPLDLNHIVGGLVQMLERVLGEDIALATERSDDLVTIEGDIGTIELAITSLAANARDAMPTGGRLTIRTRNVCVDDESCRVHGRTRPGVFACLSVEDTGIGMEPALVDRIFEPFFTTKGRAKGSGMGLSAVLGIVEQHGGWVAVESSPGSGTLFEVYLPAIPDTPDEEPDKAVSSTTWQSEGERILLVEDNPSVRSLLEDGLSESGFVVFAAASVREAMDLFEKESGNFDLLLSDVVLPDGSGPDLARHLREQRAGLAVLLNSGYSDDRIDWSTILEEGFAYLQKPYALSDLFKVIRETLKRK